MAAVLAATAQDLDGVNFGHLVIMVLTRDEAMTLIDDPSLTAETHPPDDDDGALKVVIAVAKDQNAAKAMSDRLLRQHVGDDIADKGGGIVRRYDE